MAISCRIGNSTHRRSYRLVAHYSGATSMKRAVWVHQWNQLAEQTPADIAATLLPRGITSVYIKAIDGPYYMGDVYSHPLVPRDTASMAVLFNQFAAEGLTLVPWFVPRRQAS